MRNTNDLNMRKSCLLLHTMMLCGQGSSERTVCKNEQFDDVLLKKCVTFRETTKVTTITQLGHIPYFGQAAPRQQRPARQPANSVMEAIASASRAFQQQQAQVREKRKRWSSPHERKREKCVVETEQPTLSNM